MKEKFGSTEALPAEKPCDHRFAVLEAMAKAAWNATADEFNQWCNLDAEEKIHAIDGMNAALLALADAKFPDDIEKSSQRITRGVLNALASGDRTALTP